MGNKRPAGASADSSSAPTAAGPQHDDQSQRLLNGGHVSAKKPTNTVSAKDAAAADAVASAQHPEPAMSDEPSSASVASRAALAAAAPAAGAAVALEEEERSGAQPAFAEPLAAGPIAPEPQPLVQQPDSKASATEQAPKANGYHLPSGDGPHAAANGIAPEVAAEALRPRVVEVPGYKPWVDPLAKTETFAQLESLFQSRIAFIDGAMGTSIQRYHLEEEDYRGERYAKHHKELRGNNDLLVVTKPEVTAREREFDLSLDVLQLWIVDTICWSSRAPDVRSNVLYVNTATLQSLTET